MCLFIITLSPCPYPSPALPLSFSVYLFFDLLPSLNLHMHIYRGLMGNLRSRCSHSDCDSNVMSDGSLSSEHRSSSSSSSDDEIYESGCHDNKVPYVGRGEIDDDSLEIDESNDFGEQYDTLRRSQRRLTSDRDLAAAVAPPVHGDPPRPKSTSEVQSNRHVKAMSTSRFGYKPPTRATPAPSPAQQRAAKVTANTAASSRLPGKKPTSRSACKPGLKPNPHCRPPLSASANAASAADDRRKTMPVKSTTAATSDLGRPPIMNRLRQLFHKRGASAITAVATTTKSVGTVSKRPPQPPLTTSRTIDALHPSSSSVAAGKPCRPKTLSKSKTMDYSRDIIDDSEDVFIATGADGYYLPLP